MAGRSNSHYSPHPLALPAVQRRPAISLFCIPFIVEPAAMENHERPEHADPMQIVASVLFLMTKHSHHGCPQLPHLITEHLSFIQHDSEQLTPLLRQVCGGLINRRRAYVGWLDQQKAAAKQVAEDTGGHLH
jgi:hypothetical protein